MELGAVRLDVPPNPCYHLYHPKRNFTPPLGILSVAGISRLPFHATDAQPTLAVAVGDEEVGAPARLRAVRAVVVCGVFGRREIAGADLPTAVFALTGNPSL